VVCLSLRSCAHREVTGVGSFVPFSLSLLVAALYAGGNIFCKKSAVSADFFLKWSAVATCLSSSVMSLHCWYILLNACVSFLRSSLSSCGLCLCNLYCWFMEASCASVSAVCDISFLSLFIGGEYFFCASCRVTVFLWYGRVSLWLLLLGWNVVEVPWLMLNGFVEDCMSFEGDDDCFMSDIGSVFLGVPTRPMKVDVELISCNEGGEEM